jgi:gamma-glutamyl:cysteine ligase YbdK (ATP-grasp superfamily)
MHINLPFSGDDEFARLHAAIRAVLPVLPALSASSPLVEGRRSPFLDTRVEVYRTNAAAVPAVAGEIVPETVSGREDYEARVLVPMYEAIAPLDPKRVLQREWLNSRGAIARFDRSAIEIRLADTQECPLADLAIAAACVAAIRALYCERWVSLRALQEIPLDALVVTLNACARDADQALVDDRLLRALGVDRSGCSAGMFWSQLIDSSAANEPCREPWAQLPLQRILEEGPLARRIVDAIDDDVPRQQIREVYDRLAACLADGRLFSNR